MRLHDSAARHRCVCLHPDPDRLVAGSFALPPRLALHAPRREPQTITDDLRNYIGALASRYLLRRCSRVSGHIQTRGRARLDHQRWTWPRRLVPLTFRARWRVRCLRGRRPCGIAALLAAVLCCADSGMRQARCEKRLGALASRLLDHGPARLLSLPISPLRSAPPLRWRRCMPRVSLVPARSSLCPSTLERLRLLFPASRPEPRLAERLF
jgi:hypothetical protein